MEIVNNKALLVTTQNADKIRTAIGKSKVVKDHPNGLQDILVHWDLENAQLLKNLGIKNVPSTISRDYNWPGLYKPFDHQRKTAEFLTLHKRGFCFNEQGTSKTASVLWAADYLMNIGQIRRVLVVCPLSIMRSAWVGDAFKTVMHRNIQVAHGDRESRRKVIASDADIVVINFDGIEIIEEDITNGGFDLIVIDEANAYKTPTTKRWKAMKRLVKPETWLWMLTGTPASQSPVDAFGLAKLCVPSRVPNFLGAWRDKVMVKVGMFKYVPSVKSTELVNQALQPAIRFEKKDCLDLPPVMMQSRDVPLTRQQEKYYKALKKQMLVTAAGEEITAVHAAAVLNKLLQISCIGYNTNVMTDAGWVPIQDVTTANKLWDGVEWVTHDGVVCNGVKRVLELDGVQMTYDHKVLTNDGWKEAYDIYQSVAQGFGFDRATVRIPNGYPTDGNFGGCNKKGSLAMPLRVWQRSRTREPVSTHKTPNPPSQLRVSPRQRDTQNVIQATLSNMVSYTAPMYRSAKQRLLQLWGSRHHCMRPLATVVRCVLGRHDARVHGYTYTGPRRCERPVYPRELSMGHSEDASKQHAIQPDARHTERANDIDTSCGGIWDQNCNPSRTVTPVWVADGKSATTTEVTFDILNCGPRNRFVVQGAANPFIVHNCGAVYSDSQAVVAFDCSNRINVTLEIIEESSHKVIVFVPFKHAIDIVLEKVRAAGYSADKIDGSVPANKRTAIFRRFQEDEDPHVLVIQPQAAAHGVTLTAANTIIWFGPTMSVETYLQANERINRPGQKHHMTIIKLVGSPAEQKVYKSLEEKTQNQASLISLYNNILDDEENH